MCSTDKIQENGYLTIYLALVFGIVLSLLFALIEGAAIGAVRAQAEIIADLGLDSVFAEYNREILNQYGLFFIDSSYGKNNGGAGIVEAHLSDYMSYNMEPEIDKSMAGKKNLLKLRNPYIEIDEIAYASDENGMVWKAQAVHYMKAIYGGDLISILQEQMDLVTGNELCTYDATQQIIQQKHEFEKALNQNTIVEYGEESSEGYSYQKVSNLFDDLVGGGLFQLVFPKGESISAAVMDSENYFSLRQKNGKINQGTGLHEGVNKPEGIVDELIYGEYLMKMYGSYANPKDMGLLSYQIEYILYGKKSDIANLKAFVERLFAMRIAANAISMAKDTMRKEEAEIIATAICTLLLVPQLAKALAALIVSMWVFAESISDVRQLFEGGKVPLIKDSSEWSTSLTRLLNGDLSGSKKSTSGLSYQDYLRIFLGLMNKNDKAARSLDIVEMDIRQTKGNERFRIDQCTDYIQVGFGFEDAKGHSFVFRRRQCYCN